MLQLFVIVCLLAASQHVADAVQVALRRDPMRAWVWAVCVQIAMCCATFMVVDHAAFGDAFGGAAAATYFIRTYYAFKRL